MDARVELNRREKEAAEKFTGEEAERRRLNHEVISQQDQVGEEIEEIKRDYEQNKRAVIKMLMDQILGVNIEVPKVVQQKYE